MNRRVSRAYLWIVVGLAGVASAPARSPQQSSSPVSTPGSPHRAVLNRYCVTCHNERLKTADLMLDKMDVDNVPAGREVWEKVIRKLRTGAMPPAGMPRPDQASYDSFASYLEGVLDRAAAAAPDPGRPVAHRLNRAEYVNAIRDLFAIDIDGTAVLPPDDAGYGFDNIGSVLSVSPVLMEKYMGAARKITRQAIGNPAIRPDLVTHKISPLLVQEDRMSEDLPLGSRGGAAIRHYFPADGEYVIKIRLQRARGDYIRGVANRRQLDLLLDGERIKVFTVGGEYAGKTATGDARQQQEEYERIGADAGLEVTTPVKAGPHSVGVTFFREEAYELEGAFRPRLVIADNSSGKEGEPTVDTITIRGPYNASGVGDTPSRRKIFVCRPSRGEEEELCAKKILSTLARRAYRRPATEEDVQSLVNFYRIGREQEGFDGGIQLALRRMLASPSFLFRMERDPPRVAPNSLYRVSDMDLASRLSFFLWSSIPDDELLDRADRGRLKDPLVLEQQVRRMLREPRSKALGRNFAGQWLYLRNVSAISPDPTEFPEFDENLREAMRTETELFFESLLSEDRPLMELLDANYTFLNERLARHYGIPNVYGSHFRRVTLEDGNRKGLLGQSSLLTVTSYATRTSVVLRGKWVLENILGSPPPPPPPNVPNLADRSEDGRILSVRQQMEKHRANAVCASCHARMDPIGFALENFDGIGKWRTTEGPTHTPIDSSGALNDGTKLDGPVGLRNALLNKRSQVATVVVEKLLTYALGRGVEYSDQPTVRRILKEAAPHDFRWSSLILGIVRSTPFQMRRS